MIDDDWYAFTKTVTPLRKGNAKSLLRSNRSSRKYSNSKSCRLNEKTNRTNLLNLAESSISNNEDIIRNLSRLNEKELCRIKNYAKKIYKEQFENRTIIKHLIKVIGHVQVVRMSNERTTSRDRALRKMESQLRIKDFADAHPLGHIIAACQVTEYKASGSKKHWGTPKKKRG